MKAGAGSARVIGSADDSPRATTVAERHGYGRMAQNQTQPARPAGSPVRPAPKPSAAPSLSSTNSNGVRPVPTRVPVAGGNGNGLHRTSDYDFDD
jgi:hypothetical protein